MDSTLKTSIGQQFGAAIDMLENAVRACPEALWREPLWGAGIEEQKYAEFWYLAYHAFFWLDLYLSGAVEGFAPPAPFTLDELDPAGVLPERVYSREELLGYLDHCRRKCVATVEELTAARAGELCRFPWGEVTFLGLLLDNMRHVQEHAAQLGLFLGQRAGWSPRWVADASTPVTQPLVPGDARGERVTLRPFDVSDLPDIVDLSLLAWEPIFLAWQRILGPAIYELAIYPESPDWRAGQRDVVEKICCDPKMTTWVAEVDGNVAGFIVYSLNHESHVGEVQLLAVHPDDQNGGIGTELNLFALEKFREAGMTLAEVGTGGDEGHAPARRCYEKAGYTGLPAVRYYQVL